MHNPAATYRIQFNKDFTFKHLDTIIPYLQQLGIGTLYASPIFEATPGSTHGYDVVNPLRINPEIGTLKQLESISKKLKKLNISWLQDIVPNHMAYHANNQWLMDVLEKGRRSAHADFFDISWPARVYDGRVMVPFLGVPFEEALLQGQIKMVFAGNGFAFACGDQQYPLNLRSYITILEVARQPTQIISELVEEAKQIQQADDDVSFALSFAELKEQLASLHKQPAIKKIFRAVVSHINGDKDLLSQLSNQQYYQLCFWQETEKQINFRRFFTVNGLICLNMQLPKVFDKCHELVKELLDKNIIQGLRLDHIDGLYDPAGYLQRLRTFAGKETYIVVEKILEDGEALPADWPIEGTTGYDFLAAVNNLFTQAESKKQFAAFYRDITRDKLPVNKAIQKKKSLILYEHMAGELQNLYQLFCDLELADASSIKENNIKLIIAEFLIRCPVYRYYGNSFPLAAEDQQGIKDIFKNIREAKPEIEAAARLLENVLLKNGNADYNSRALQFYQRCMQFTGPIMAKGVEDTLMYTYDRFIGHNEVGDTPETFGLPVDEFHAMMVNRQLRWPLAINATATHDTKRGEGVRARLNAITDMAAEWITIVKHWQTINSGAKTNNAPDDNDEYLLYQTITGSYPMPGEDHDDFANRIEEYLVKGLREAKLHTQWAEPNEIYEEGTKKFVNAILKPRSDFMKSFLPFLKKVADYGIINSLAQTVLKFTCPGVPDVYQGCELWDLSMVDPDNRRPVDYNLRAKALDAIAGNKITIKALWKNRYSGHIKLWLTSVLFNQRRDNPQVFKNGDYIPLTVNGKYQDNVMAFARSSHDGWYIVALPLHLALINTDSTRPHELDWQNTRVVLPPAAPSQWRAITGGKTFTAANQIEISTIFKQLPLAVLKSVEG